MISTWTVNSTGESWRETTITSILGRRKAVHHVTETVTWKGGRLFHHIWKKVMSSEEKEPETLNCPGIALSQLENLTAHSQAPNLLTL